MQLHLDWEKELGLKAVRSPGFGYSLGNSANIPLEPGVYIFGRRFGNSFEALYVGKAINLDRRIRQQLNNLRLMQHIKNASIGHRILLLGVLRGNAAVLNKIALSERALITYFLAEGHDIVNVSGTRRRKQEITSTGNRRYFPKTIFLER